LSGIIAGDITMKQYFTYFVDDNIRFLENLTKNKPASIFDDPYLKLHKELHDKYGLKVQFNLFYQNIDKTWDLSMMTDAYKDEFLANKDWIKFGFHAKHELPDYPYINATYEQVWDDYTAIEKAIEKFAGREMITKSLITHWLVMTKEGVQALIDKGAKIIGSTTGDIIDYPEIKSAFSTEHNFTLAKNKDLPVSKAGVCVRSVNGVSSMPYLCNYNHLENNDADKYSGKIKMYKDPETGMFYNNFAAITMNASRLDDFPKEFEELVKHEYVGILIHEQYFYDDFFIYEPDFAEKIDKAFEILLGAGFEHISMEDLISFQE